MAVGTIISGSGESPVRPWAEAALLLGAHFEVARGRRKQAAVVEATGGRVSRSLYSRLEGGEVRIDKPHVVSIILDALEVPLGDYHDQLTQLGFEASREGWASTFRSGHREVVPDSMLRLTSLEEAATEFFVVDRNAVPGQLQTEAYARIVTGYTLPASLKDAGLQEVIVGLRVERSRRFVERLTSDRPKGSFFVEEAVLYADFGHPEVLIDQLQAMLDIVENRALPAGIRVMTARAPLAVPVSTLARLGFRKSLLDSVPDVIYNETGRMASFHRGSLPGTDEAADPDYVDLDDLVDNVLMRAPGYRDSRRLIENALMAAQLRL
ncbi:Scr1 family TA system antitoxin-like transcriptional regulator [Kitasatospora purpeofusca]|uniref:Scr1 family TA system antitoxin-like transcriptional regulator n=1 Tax=Kitasatospora purpeofusca TaxID=67352 RepID=UPI002A5A7590|nr:Scr1 family TA system antitoxin-like transcriptional regulator [Kitasatospora purpeofusca]MDY0816066.1 Scr1 family TA system antitoxin-like transcriptional regulator [Kitasatospora purpeofusca]